MMWLLDEMFDSPRSMTGATIGNVSVERGQPKPNFAP